MNIYKKIKYLISTLVMLFVAGCSSDDASVVSETGWVKFTLDIEQNDLAPCNGEFSLSMYTADGAYGNDWTNFNDFPSYESFTAGAYNAYAVSGDLDAEGYDCQCYVANADFVVQPSAMSDVLMTAKLHQSIIQSQISDNIKKNFQKCELILHTAGHTYQNAIPEKALLLSPGFTTAFVKFTRGSDTVMLSPDFSFNNEGNRTYVVDLSYVDNAITIESNGQKASIAISDDIFSTAAPEIQPVGFTPDEPLVLTEGYPASQQIEMNVNSSAGLKWIRMTLIGLDRYAIDLPKECDLIKDASAFTAKGLQISQNNSGMNINFTRLLENLSVDINTNVKFLLQACDNLGRVSDPMTLSVNINSIDFAVVENQAAVIGENIAKVTLSLNQDKVEPKDFKAYLINEQGDRLSQLEIVSTILQTTKRLITLSIKMEPGISEQPIGIYFMDLPKVETTLKWSVPEYTLDVDAFATQAVITVNANNADARECIASYALIYANDAEASITMRDPQKGRIIIGGLKPSSNYTIKSVVIDGSFIASTNVKTENEEEVPEGDFEDADIDIKYKRLEQGGKYSATAFPIFNMQNYKDVNVSWVRKYWTSVNAKTFCTKASTHNTWYMQPSSMIDAEYYKSGSKSIKICSVGWSLDGTDVEPYVQDSDNYRPYNGNVPYVRHRAAGKLFLGSYEFNPSTLEEKYIEGVKFTSRPTSLNGFYKYIPDETQHSDAGIVKIEIINDEGANPITIASAQAILYTSPDFIAFNVPLNYNLSGVKATKLKILFASTINEGTIEEEDMNVPCTANPADGSYIGSTLWIDNLSFAY